MTVYRSERERRDEETGRWQLFDEIMEAIRCKYQSPSEVIEALINAMARVIVQADMPPEQVEDIKGTLDSAIEWRRKREFSRP
jgi:hypothetical protein